MNFLIISHGDPGGISSEILLKSLITRYETNFFQNFKILIFGSIESIIKHLININYLNYENEENNYKNYLLRFLKDTFIITNINKLEKIFSNNNISLNKLPNIIFFDPFLEPLSIDDTSLYDLIYILFSKDYKKLNFSQLSNIKINSKELEYFYKNFLESKSFYNKNDLNDFNNFNFYNYLNKENLKNIKKLNFFKFLDFNRKFYFKKIISKNLFYIKYGENFLTNGFFSEIFLFLSCIFSFKLFSSGVKTSILTLPVSKKSISFVKKNFIGQTEYFQNFYKKKFKKILVNMIFYSDIFSLLLVTTHVPLFKLKKSINRKSLENSLINAINYYKKIYGNNGDIYLLGINPHASDDGLIGKEELWIKNIVNNFNNKEKNNVINIRGPYPADAIFSKYFDRNNIKMFISFYHDQGTIPFKLLSKGGGVNITFGLPILRVSPDHGTAFDIVFKNKANFDSTIKALEIIEKLID